MRRSMPPSVSLPLRMLLPVLLSFAPLAACGGDDGGSDPGLPDAPPDTADVPGDVRSDLPDDARIDVLPPDVPPSDPGPVDASNDGSTDASADLPPSDSLPTDAPPTDVPADAPDVPPEPHPLFDFAGTVELLEYPSDSGGWSSVSAEFRTAAYPRMHRQEGADKACELWLRDPDYPPTCAPACADTDYCGLDLVCHPQIGRVSAGVVTVTATGGPYTLTPGDGDWYSVAPDPASDLFAKGTTVRVQAAGADVPAFDVSLPGMGPLVATIPSPLELVDDVDTVLTWTPQGDGADLEVVLQTGHHIGPQTSILYCRVPEADGRVTLPGSLIRGMAAIGGPGLFPHPSFLRKVRRDVVDAPQGAVELALVQQVGVSISHNPW